MGLEDDLRLAKATSSDTATAAAPAADGSTLLAELRVYDSAVTKEDYFDAASNTWDIEGLEADLRLAKGSAIEKLEASAIKVNGLNGLNGASKSNGEKSGAQLFD
ncbi:unnamed protein product, partial [Symbiodinium sp. CCMP2456]